MVITAHTPIFVSGTELGCVSIHCDVKVAINVKYLAVRTVVTLVPHLKVAGIGLKNLCQITAEVRSNLGEKKSNSGHF